MNLHFFNAQFRTCITSNEKKNPHRNLKSHLHAPLCEENLFDCWSPNSRHQDFTVSYWWDIVCATYQLSCKPKCPFHKDETKAKQLQELIQTQFTQFTASIWSRNANPSLRVGFNIIIIPFSQLSKNATAYHDQIEVYRWASLRRNTMKWLCSLRTCHLYRWTLSHKWLQSYTQG